MTLGADFTHHLRHDKTIIFQACFNGLVGIFKGEASDAWVRARLSHKNGVICAVLCECAMCEELSVGRLISNADV